MPPDQAARFVVAAPDERLLDRGHGVDPGTVEQRGEHGLGVPFRGAHPDVFPARTDHHAALAVREQGVFAQDMQWKGLVHVHPG